MKIPSLKYLNRKAKASLIRFPFALLVAVVGSLVAVYVVDFDYNSTKDYTNLYHLIMTCVIGLPMFLAITIFSEKLEITKLLKFIIRTSGFVFLLVYFLLLPDVMLEKHYIRLAVFLIGFTSLVSISPFIGFEKHNAFWQFNKILFLRLLLTGLYAFVLYTGISLAMLAIDKLFFFEIKGEWYLRLWIIITGIFSVWFFLSGIPLHYQKLENIHIYPKGLKIFTQYILIPIVIIYALILYSYFAKILITQVWPVGWVVYLVSGYSILGLFCYLLLYPVYNIEQNKGVRIFTKVFFYSAFPLLIMLFVAIFKRTNEYGFTENRLFIILTGIWLLINFGYIVYIKFTKIRIVPVSMVIISFLSVIGPWNVFKISKSSQIHRLENIFTQNKILINGKVVKIKSEIDSKTNVEICSILTYVADCHGYKNLQPYFSENLDTIFKVDSLNHFNSYNGVKKLTDIIGIEYLLYNYEHENNNISIACQNFDEGKLLTISGYDYFIKYKYYCYNNLEINNDTTLINNYVLSDTNKLIINFKPNKGTFSLIVADTTCEINLSEFMNNLYSKAKHENNYGYIQENQENMTYQIDKSNLKIKILFNLLNGSIASKKINFINEIQCEILISNK